MGMPGFIDDGIALAKQAMSKNLHSNDAINRIDKNNPAGFLGGIPGTVINMRKGDNFSTAIKDAHTGANGNLNHAAIAGSFITAGAAYRVASGGGVYKDQNGNTNMVGVPFI